VLAECYDCVMIVLLECYRSVVLSCVRTCFIFKSVMNVSSKYLREQVLCPNNISSVYAPNPCVTMVLQECYSDVTSYSDVTRVLQ
jgi:hypothetical protein